MKLGQTPASAAAAFNGYTWPTSLPATAGYQLTTDASGTLTWEQSGVPPWTAKGQLQVGTGVGTDTLLNAGTNGFVLVPDSTTASGLKWVNSVGLAVAYTQTGAPTSPVDGQLWYDCSTGYFKVYQSCVAPFGWTKVAEPGLPVLVGNTSAAPAFTGGSGTSASPYTCTVTTTAPGTSVFVVNTVTVTGLAPNQYVPIVDLNAVTNGGRYSFSNNYADATGTLVFQTIFIDQPNSAPATSYTANIKVGYGSAYINAIVNVIASLTISSPGSISGSATVGGTLTYATGTAAGGTAPYAYTWVWKKASDNSTLQTGGATYVVTAGEVGDRVYVKLTATDSVAATATANTTNYPASPATITPVLSLVSPGSIAGTAQVGQTLTYTTGSATGGIAPYTYSWFWKRTSDNSVLQTNGSTYVLAASDAGDNVYVALTATDSVVATVTGNTTNYPTPPAVVTGGVFPNLPAALVTGPTQIPQIVSGTWADGATPITSTGCLQISLDGTTFNQGPLTPTNGSPVYMQWAPTGATCGDAAHGTTITGTLTNGTYTNNFSLTLDRNPNAFTLSAITGQALSTTATSNSVPLAGTNAPAYITYTAGSPNTLTNFKVSVGGGAYVTVPTSGTTLTVNPGQTLQFQGDVGGTNSTAYTATINVGATTAAWSVTTAALVPTVTTPTISSPANGSTGLNPGLVIPAGLTINSTAFSSSNGAGTNHASSDWELATDSGFTTVVYSASASTTYLTSWFVPKANLTVSTTYYVRVRYTSGTGGGGVVTTSSYSAGSSLATGPSFLPAIGQAYGGGYFAGQISTAGNGVADYNLVVAPVTSGSLQGQYGGATPANIQWKTSDTGPDTTAQSVVYGATATVANSSATFPLFNWCVSGATGPNAGVYDATNVTGTGIGGFNDWYIPASNELEILYYNLKPDTTANTTLSGINPNAVPARASNYTAGTPAQTTSTLFQTGGAQAFSTAIYWSSTEYSTNTIYAWKLNFSNGLLYLLTTKSNYYYARAIRRVAV